MSLSRSLLFVPATNVRAVEKCTTLDCDGIILDLEDSVAADAKEAARQKVAALLQSGHIIFRKSLIRVNAVDSGEVFKDIKMIGRCSPVAIVIPKVQSAQDVMQIERALENMAEAKNTKLWVMIETARGVMNLAEICGSSPRLEGIILGPNDLLKDLGGRVTPNQDALITSYGLAIIAARAYGLKCIDGVYKYFKDTDGLTRNCQQGRDLGFDGKSLIHPGQIAITNAQYGPNADDITHAKALIAAFEAAQARGEGLAVLDDEMIENLHVEQARAMLRVASQISDKDNT